MKQAQYSPLSVAEMAISLYAVNEGFLDDLDLGQVLSFESGLHDHMKSNHGDLFAKVNETGDWNDEIQGEFKQCVENYRETGSW